MFESGTTRMCLSIPIVSDTILEFDETFYVQLETDDEDVSLGPANASITITDDDSKILQI